MLGSRKKRFLQFLGRLDIIGGIGVNRLIKEGAIMVTNVKDIINNIPEFQELKKENIKQNYFVKKEYRKIYSILNDEPCSLDEISFKTGNTSKCTLNLLSLMELEDLVEEIVGVGYVRKFKD